MTEKEFMLLAIEKAREGISSGQTPFGACIVKDNEIVSCSHNEVWAGCDITAHAEVQAIRQACKTLNTIDLSGCIIYSTCEPCPMCFSACHWARITKIVYGASIADAEKAGFNELCISNEKLKSEGASNVMIVSGFLREEAKSLFDEWKETNNPREY